MLRVEAGLARIGLECPDGDGTRKRLGPYEIVSRIGAGGMGEVWRARDTRLDREVAIKILPESFAANEGRPRPFRT